MLLNKEYLPHFPNYQLILGCRLDSDEQKLLVVLQVDGLKFNDIHIIEYMFVHPLKPI
jgi:hypothetical protein